MVSQSGCLENSTGVINVEGILVRGHGVASAPSNDYPYGTLIKQKPYFMALGLDLGGFYMGTLNISIAPRTWEMVTPDYAFHRVAWSDLHPPEDFSFSSCRILFDRHVYPGWIYYPHPQTKVRHFQDSSLIEVISEFIPTIRIGNSLSLEINNTAVRIWG
jgi:hypothetical protein